jgi:hypothetical protein
MTVLVREAGIKFPAGQTMKFLVVAITALTLVACENAEQTAQIEPPADSDYRRPTFGEVSIAAENGDYQAQRNLAYGFVALPYEGQNKNQVLGCAWYLVVFNQGHQQVHDGDRGNVDTYCGRLEPDLLETAKHHAQNFLEKIAQNRAGGISK